MTIENELEDERSAGAIFDWTTMERNRLTSGIEERVASVHELDYAKPEKKSRWKVYAGAGLLTLAVVAAAYVGARLYSDYLLKHGDYAPVGSLSGW